MSVTKMLILHKCSDEWRGESEDWGRDVGEEQTSVGVEIWVRDLETTRSANAALGICSILPQCK